MPKRWWRALGAVLLLLAAMPSPAHATYNVIIHNKDCRSIESATHVAVHFIDGDSLWCGCTDKYYYAPRDTIGPGPDYKVTENRVRVSLVASCTRAWAPYKCRYAHEAEGTTGGPTDDLQGDATITCQQDGANVCQCTKD